MGTNDLPRVRRLTLRDLPAMAALHAEEGGHVPSDFLQSRSEAELLAYLDGRVGQAFGVFSGQALQATGLLQLPERNAFAGQPGFPYVPACDWPGRAAFVESALVRGTSRGRGFQRLLIKARAAAAEAAGRRWLCAGVHVDNGPSRRNLVRSGFLLIGCREDPAPARLGFLRPLNGSSLPLRPETLRRVALDDLDGHRAAFAEALVGAGLDHAGRVLYRAPVRALSFPNSSAGDAQRAA